MAETVSSVEEKLSGENKIGHEAEAITGSTKIIYVPQGYCAKLSTATEAYALEGLYTDGFTSCNIVVCIGKDRISLAHFDHLNLEMKIKNQIEWTSDPTSKTIIIHRNAGEIVKKRLLDYLRTEMPAQEVIPLQMDDQHDGVYVSFKPALINGIYPNIRKFSIGERPNDLIHHPQEQQVLAVQKIEQVIGLRAKNELQRVRDRRFFMFDGRAWEPFDDIELKIDTSHEFTREEMRLFSTNTLHIKIAGNLAGIVRESARSGIETLASAEEIGMEVAKYLEGYLNNYNYELLFKRNLRDAINSKEINGDQSLPSDKDFQRRLNAILPKQKTMFKDIKTLVDEYAAMPSSAFKEQFMSEYGTLRRHYTEREYYEKLRQESVRIKKEVSKIRDTILERYQQERYEEAVTYCLMSLEKLTHVCLKSDPELAKAYYNLGKCLFKTKKYEKAIFLLDISLTLRRSYTHPKPTEEEIKRTEDALAECRAQQAADASVQEEQVAVRLLSSSSLEPGTLVLPRELSRRIETVVVAANRVNHETPALRAGGSGGLHFAVSDPLFLSDNSFSVPAVNKLKKKKKGKKITD